MDAIERQVGELTVIIKRDACIGSGNCVKVAPDLFHLDDETLVTFNEPIGDVGREQTIEACQVCPVQALIAYDRDGNQLAP